MKSKMLLWLVGLIAGLLAVAGTASAFTIADDGNLVDDSDYGSVSFTLLQPSTVSIRTTSYVNHGDIGDASASPPVNATCIAGSGNPCGFDPYLTLVELVDETTRAVRLLAANNDIDFDNGIWDALIEKVLTPGSYIVWITEDYNQPTGNPQAGDGSVLPPYQFIKPDLPTDPRNWTGSEYGCSQGRFCNYLGENRTSFWSLNITAVPVSVAEPATLGLMALGFAGMAFGRRRRTG